MPLIPIAAFLAGAILSLLLPLCLLIALVVWYTMVVRRMPDASASAELGSSGPGSSGPVADPAASPTTRASGPGGEA